MRALVQGQESGLHVGRPSFGAVEQSLAELKQAVDMRLKKDDMFSDDYKELVDLDPGDVEIRR